MKRSFLADRLTGAVPRLVGTSLLGALFLCVAAGCRRQAPDRTADGRVIVSYWEKWTGFEGEAMQAVVDDFNASQNRILVRKLTISQIDQKLMLATAGGNPPDLAGLWSHSVNDFAEKGALTPLNKAVEKAGITRADYIPVFWDLCMHRGFLWALPTTPATVALHWNKKLFREAGLDPERPPRSLDELDRMAEQLTIVEIERNGKKQRMRFPELTAQEKQDKAFSIIQLGHVPLEPGWWLSLWPYWFGGSLWDGKRRITADSPENIETFHWVQGYALKYGVENLQTFGASFGNFASPQNPFLSGKVAMVLQGVWMYNFIDKFAPDMEWGAAPFPSKDPKRWPNVTIAECDVLVIPKGARHPREAFEFMRYVSQRKEMEKLAIGQRKFSPLAQVSPDFVRRHPNPAIETFIRLAHSPNARYVPRISIWNEYRDEMLASVDRIMSLEQTPEEALAEVQRRVQWKFDRALRRWDRIKKKRLKEWRDYDAW